MPTPPPDDPLDPLLDRWASTPTPSPRLAADVWQRIATETSAPGRGSGIWAHLEAWFERPVFAACFVAACALLGVFLAEIRIAQAQRERNAQLARSYLQLIDPLVIASTPERRS